MVFKLDSLESYTVEEMTTTSNIVVQSQGTLADRKSIKKMASVKRHDSESGDDGIKKSKKRKKHKKASSGDKILNTESSKVSEGSRRREKSLLLYYKRTGKSCKRGYMLNEVKTDEDKGDETDEETSDTEEEIRIVKVCEWIDSLAKLWNRDPEYLDTGQNDNVKKEKKENSSKKVKLSVEDVKIDNPNAVSKFRINPLREKLQATIFDMVLSGATHGLDINDVQLIIQCESPRGIVCTHGRMIDILCTSSEKITNLRRVTFLVMDEADHMFDMGFEPQIMRIIRNIRHDRHTVGGMSVVNKDITQLVEVRPESERFLRLLEILGEWYEKIEILFFVQSQKKCDALLKDLFKRIYPCLSLHGARGIDVKELELVVNYDAPNHYEYYVHRIGRTGTAEQKGCAVTFIAEDDAKYAPYLVKALELSEQPIPDDLKAIADGFMAKVRQGTEQAHGTGYVGSGFKFTEEEEEVTKAAKKAQAKEYGFEEYKSDSENEIDVVRKACVVGFDTSQHQAAIAHIATIAATVKANAAAMNPPVTTNQLLPNGGGLTSLPKVIAKDEPIEESSQFLVDSDDASDKESDTKEPLRTRKKASPAEGSSNVEEGKTEKKVRQRTVKNDKDVEDGLVTISSTYDEVSDAEKALVVKAIDADSEGEEIDLSKHESEDISHTYGWPPLVCCFGSAQNVFVPSGRPTNRFLDCKFKTVEARVEAFHRKEEELKKELEIVKNQHASDSAVLLLVTRELEKVSLKLVAANDAKNLPLSRAENISKMISIHAEKETISNKEIAVLKSELEKARNFEVEVKERDKIIEKLDAAIEVFKMARSHAYGFADQWCTKAIELEEQLEETNMMKKYASVSLVSLIKQLEGSNTRLQVMECEVIALKDKAKLMATVEKEEIKLKTKLEIFKDEKSKTLSELERSKEEEEKSEPDMQSLASAFHQASSERVLKNRLLSLGGQNYKTREEDRKLVIKPTNEKYEKMLHEVEQTKKPFESSRVDWEMRGIVEDLSKMEFKLKGENVGLSLKKKGNLEMQECCITYELRDCVRDYELCEIERA
ncbi:unnamed protein product [Brassica oleracea var. botrytis]|uniref:RNA helicase n=2 Tax=Brassica oleracea TaxID=3712 RepID=A0A0D3ALW8_BRAOL|nr:unnamed protein product [Brassica oleracea]